MVEKFKVGDFAQIKSKPSRYFDSSYLGKVVRIKRISDIDYYVVEMVNRPSDADEDEIPLTQYADDNDLIAPGEVDKFQVGKHYRVLDTANEKANVYSDMQGAIVKIVEIDDDGDYYFELINPKNHPGASTRDYASPENLEYALAPVTDAEVEEEMKPKFEAKFKVGDVARVKEQPNHYWIDKHYRGKLVKIKALDSDGDYVLELVEADDNAPDGQWVTVSRQDDVLEYADKFKAGDIAVVSERKFLVHRYKVGDKIKITGIETRDSDGKPYYNSHLLSNPGVEQIVNDNDIDPYVEEVKPVELKVGGVYFISEENGRYGAVKSALRNTNVKITSIDKNGDYWITRADGGLVSDFVSKRKASTVFELAKEEAKPETGTLLKVGDVARLKGAGRHGVPDNFEGREVKIVHIDVEDANMPYKVQALDTTLGTHTWWVETEQLEKIDG